MPRVSLTCACVISYSFESTHRQTPTKHPFPYVKDRRSLQSQWKRVPRVDEREREREYRNPEVILVASDEKRCNGSFFFSRDACIADRRPTGISIRGQDNVSKLQLVSPLSRSIRGIPLDNPGPQSRRTPEHFTRARFFLNFLFCVLSSSSHTLLVPNFLLGTTTFSPLLSFYNATMSSLVISFYSGIYLPFPSYKYTYYFYLGKE